MKQNLNSSPEAAQAEGLVNDRGLLLRSPIDVFDDSKHFAPKRSDFAQEHVYMLFKADVFEAKANELVQKAEKLREKASILKDQPDPQKRKAILRREKLVEQLSMLEAELHEQGILLPS